MEPALALPQNLQNPLPQILQNPLPQEEDYQQSDGANASRDSDDTLILDEGSFNCESATNDFARQSGIPRSKSGPFKEHTFLVEICKLGQYYAKCLLCTKEFPIEMETKKDIFLGSYVHMSCVLFDEKVHIVRYFEDVKKFNDINVQLRKILMCPNMNKNAHKEQWDPSDISGCISNPSLVLKKCRLLDLPHDC